MTATDTATAIGEPPVDTFGAAPSGRAGELARNPAGELEQKLGFEPMATVGRGLVAIMGAKEDGPK